MLTLFTPAGNLDKIYWNEKLVFDLPESELETLSHLKFRIVKEEHFSDDDFVGETMQVFSLFGCFPHIILYDFRVVKCGILFAESSSKELLWREITEV